MTFGDVPTQGVRLVKDPVAERTSKTEILGAGLILNGWQLLFGFEGCFSYKSLNFHSSFLEFWLFYSRAEAEHDGIERGLNA